MPNAPLLTRTLTHIEHHPDEHYQSAWALDAAGLRQRNLPVPECGAAYCYAGHAAILAGHIVTIDFGAAFIGTETVDVVAARELGISVHDAVLLFAGGNTLDDLRDMVTALTEEGSLARWHGSRHSSTEECVCAPCADAEEYYDDEDEEDW